jgi:chromosomal replication initiation ATPase DnaA
MVDCEDPVLKEAMEASVYAVGDDAFRTAIEDELNGIRGSQRAYGDIQWPQGRERSVEEVIALVADAYHVPIEQLRTHGRHAGTAKKIAIELSCQFCGQSQREIGRHFGYTGNGAVGKQRAVLRDLLKHDPEAQRLLKTLRMALAKE